MDPDLAPLHAPLASLGLRPALATLIAKAVGGERVFDLLCHLPESYIDRSSRPSIRDAVPGTIATFGVEVVRHDAPATPKQPWRVVVTDGTGFAELTFFRQTSVSHIPPGTKLTVSGKLDTFQNRLTMPHPDHVAVGAETVPSHEPVWRLTAGLWPRQVGAAMAKALARVPELPEWHDAALVRRDRFPPLIDALRAVQAPNGPPLPDALRRLAYDELLAGQVALGLIRGRARARPGRAHVGDGTLRHAALTRFGHALTPAQSEALATIDADMGSERRMLRLLQGDVGSGKTVVAVLAMLTAVEAGAQAALMAPTELLAKQHHRTIARLAPVPAALLTGTVKGTARAHALRGLADGGIKIVVGTHALFQEQVAYRDLGLAVIDEQHRFGVDQRVLMGAKGAMADVLVMTATPIPRTMLLTQWGDMDVSRLTGKPAGRQAIRTSIHSLSTLADVCDGVARKLAEGAQVFWVCPLVAGRETVDTAAAEDRHAELRTRFGPLVGLAHGQMPAEARDTALASFAAGGLRLLVATTVIEVGVDVPQATVMVIEGAERFGLAQLHQLRGRVGRGADTSFCLLLHADGIAEAGRRRLAFLRDTDDGFSIADEDFRARGGGDLLGTRQSGEPGWRLANPVRDEALLHMAHRDAAVLLNRDPKLTSERGRAIRILLRLFNRKAAMRTLVSG